MTNGTTLELGKNGTAGVEKGALPVLLGGQVVARLRAVNWKEAATAQIGERSWSFAKRKRELTGRWSAEPEDAVRLRARQTSFWKGAWEADLGGIPVQIAARSIWGGTHQFTSGSQLLAESGSVGSWAPRPTLRVLGDLPLEAQVFLLWWELIVVRRAAAATTAGVVAATGAIGSS